MSNFHITILLDENVKAKKKVFNILISKNISEKMFRLGTLFLVLSEYIQGNSGGLQKTQFIKRGQKSFLF